MRFCFCREVFGFAVRYFVFSHFHFLSRPELQFFIASELNKVVIPARKEQTDRPFLFRFSLRYWQVCFSSG